MLPCPDEFVPRAQRDRDAHPRAGAIVPADVALPVVERCPAASAVKPDVEECQRSADHEAVDEFPVPECICLGLNRASRIGNVCPTGLSLPDLNDSSPAMFSYRLLAEKLYGNFFCERNKYMYGSATSKPGSNLSLP